MSLSSRGQWQGGNGRPRRLRILDRSPVHMAVLRDPRRFLGGRQAARAVDSRRRLETGLRFQIQGGQRSDGVYLEGEEGSGGLPRTFEVGGLHQSVGAGGCHSRGVRVRGGVEPRPAGIDHAGLRTVCVSGRVLTYVKPGERLAALDVLAWLLWLL